MSAHQSASGASVRTSARQAERVAQIAAQRVLRDAADPTPSWVNEGAVRAILGDRTDGLKPCAGGCTTRLLGFQEWQALEKPQRKRLRELGINRVASYGRCRECTERGAPKGPPGRKNYAPKVSAETKARIPEMWAEIQTGGGGFRVLGERLGVTAERARQLVRELELSHVDQRIERSETFLEELHFLVSLGLGVYELSKALNIPCDSLVRKVDNLRHNGKTTVSFPGYFREEWEDAA